MMQYIYVFFYSLEHLNFSIYRCQHLILFHGRSCFSRIVEWEWHIAGWRLATFIFGNPWCFFSISWVVDLFNCLWNCYLYSCHTPVRIGSPCVFRRGFICVDMLTFFTFKVPNPKSYNLNAWKLCTFLNWHKNPYHPWDERYIYLPHRIHVWYSYLHLPSKSTKCR